MIRAILSWFDAHVWGYWALAWTPLLVIVVWTLSRAWREARGELPGPSSLRQTILWGALVFLTLLGWRWPVLINPDALSPDESQLVAGALTLQHRPFFWRTIDGGTAGPLDFYALLPLHWLGVPQDFFCARLTGLLLITIAILGVRRALHILYGATVARIGCLPILFFFAFVMSGDFLHYSTEHVPFALLAIAAALLASLQANPVPRPGLIVGLGLTLGALPWAKLQATPFSATLGALALVGLLRRSGRPLRAKLADAGQLVATALAPTALSFLLIVASGEWTHFYNSYIAYNHFYAINGVPFGLIVSSLWNQVKDQRIFPLFIFTALGVALAGAVVSWRAKSQRAVHVAGAIFLATGIFVVFAPHRDFQHYFLFLIVPAGLWAGIALGGCWTAEANNPRGRRYLLMAAGVYLAIPIINRAQLNAPAEIGYLLDHWRNPISRPSQLIGKITHDGDTLAVWGWAPHYYVETGLPQATRDGHTQRQIEDSPLKTYYLLRFLEEMQHRPPAVFVDAVTDGAFGFSNGTTAGHEIFPALAALIRERYRLVDTIEGVRIYRRADRPAP